MFHICRLPLYTTCDAQLNYYTTPPLSLNISSAISSRFQKEVVVVRTYKNIKSIRVSLLVVRSVK